LLYATFYDATKPTTRSPPEISTRPLTFLRTLLENPSLTQHVKNYRGWHSPDGPWIRSPTQTSPDNRRHCNLMLKQLVNHALLYNYQSINFDMKRWCKSVIFDNATTLYVDWDTITALTLLLLPKLEVVHIAGERQYDVRKNKAYRKSKGLTPYSMYHLNQAFNHMLQLRLVPAEATLYGYSYPTPVAGHRHGYLVPHQTLLQRWTTGRH
jgi:hypothetical protein